MRVKTNLKIDRALVQQAISKGNKRGLWAAMDYLASESKAQVPLDEGTLKMSCAVSVSDDGKTGCVSYDTPYAVRQHEELSYHHQRGRKAKYLEDPINDSSVQSNMMKLMQTSYKELR